MTIFMMLTGYMLSEAHPVDVLIDKLSSLFIRIYQIFDPYDYSNIRILADEINGIKSRLPDNSFLYMYKNRMIYYCYSLNGEEDGGICGPDTDYVGNHTKILEDLKNGYYPGAVSMEKTLEIREMICNTTKRFINYATDGSSPYGTKLSDKLSISEPKYTQNINKCQN